VWCPVVLRQSQTGGDPEVCHFLVAHVYSKGLREVPPAPVLHAFGSGGESTHGTNCLPCRPDQFPGLR